MALLYVFDFPDRRDSIEETSVDQQVNSDPVFSTGLGDE